jgi:hypothetical protein
MDRQIGALAQSTVCSVSKHLVCPTTRRSLKSQRPRGLAPIILRKLALILARQTLRKDLSSFTVLADVFL